MKTVVVGASVGGLCAAAALAGRAKEVLVLERRDVPSGVGSVAAQGTQPHVLLQGGAAALERLVPGFVEDLIADGAIDPGEGVTPVHWWAGGAVRHHLPDLGVRTPLATRPLLEGRLRESVAAMAGVRIRGGVGVRGLIIEGGRVLGVRIDDDIISADLVVDASGRGSKSPQWLADAGVGTPPVSEVRVDSSYTSVLVRRRPGDADGALIALVQNSPGLARGGAAFAAEGDCWQWVVGGYFGDFAEATPDAMGAFARSLPDPVLATLLQNEWLCRPRRSQFRSSQRRHWDKVRDLPTGFVALGDSVVSLNPIYGQGMTSAALQAEAFAVCLDRFGNDRRLPAAVAKALARVVATPWQVATGGDFLYEQSIGKKPPGTKPINRYLEKVFYAAAHDEIVNIAVSRVGQMLAPPTSVLAPSIMRRVRRVHRISRRAEHQGVSEGATVAASDPRPAGHRSSSPGFKPFGGNDGNPIS
ncbi:MAG: FAD-dependent oxidoreductase [Mycobacteriales bacterium]